MSALSTERERERTRLAALNAAVADALGIDRTVPRGWAEIRKGYKLIQGGYEVDYGRGKTKGEGLVIFVPERLGDLPVDVPRHASGARNVCVPHPDDAGLLLDVASEARLADELVLRHGRNPPYAWRMQTERIDAWAARWLAAHYPAFEAEIATYRTPAAPYATSWDALLPALQGWLATDVEQARTFFAKLADGIELARGPQRVPWDHPAGHVVGALIAATREEVCDAIRATVTL